MKISVIIKEIRRRIKGSFCIVKEQGMIVESGVTVMGDVRFGSEPYLITLRKNCRISGNVTLVNHDGDTWAFRHSDSKYSDVIKYGRIEVGEYSFVGTGSIIMPGVKIGKNCVIGAGSVITHDIPDETVAVGVPARPICSVGEYAGKA
ncbi:acyltransferase [Holdemania massiliensis]|uniref:acyltransferase n=1 Tax=Holdemania massiliensis TaxID=1468449 RepID=UPI001F051444|nr:acyltransferase [Holdemania massiliensis]MCH1940704.1 acyltransferase [Holdemania massiliensis]